MGTTTPLRQFYLPATNETGWGPLVNANWSLVDSTLQLFVIDTTATLPAGSVTMNGSIIIEDPGTGTANLAVYKGGLRYRICGERATVPLGNGPQASLGQIGGSGPTNSAQFGWRQVTADDGTTEWEPVWR